MARYYPGGSRVPGSKGYDPEPLPNDLLENNFFSDWLYGDWNASKLQTYRFLNAIPGISHYMDYLLDIRADREYMDRYGLDYTDIHDPRKLSSHSSSERLYGYALNFVSDNIKRLYG